MNTQFFLLFAGFATYGWIECHCFSIKGIRYTASVGGSNPRLNPRILPRQHFGRRMNDLDSASHEINVISVSAPSGGESLSTQIPAPKLGSVSFSHIHLFVDHLEPLHVYKELENNLNRFHTESSGLKLEGKRQLWATLCGSDAKPFVPHNRDLVKQLLTGFGFRVTGYCFPSEKNPTNTKSVLITSKDPNGVQILVTAAAEAADEREPDDFVHFDIASHLEFYQNHADRQGIAVLGFHAVDVASIYNRYNQLHPQLIHSFREYPHGIGWMTKVLQVFSYYNETQEEKHPDRGTMLRFIESYSNHSSVGTCPLPGLEFVTSTFDCASEPAYCDHWVSNVRSRTDFCQTLQDVLGFTPKVDFNAGVIAAGEAQIESTVIGNTSPFETTDKKEALKDQTQVFLPINNALSSVGHVHEFLEEIGQGIQHCASRVEDLVRFVQLCNEMRDLTGEGFSFLNIPRSYYGVLSVNHLMTAANVSETMAKEIMSFCDKTEIISKDGAVDMSLTETDLHRKFTVEESKWTVNVKKAFLRHKGDIVRAILSSRYCNIYALLGDQISDKQYLGIVRNKILVDVQGSDILYQIFTCNILQRSSDDEAPFFEFIQRVCSLSTAKIKTGCGGFGIRNFLTLFLSIEISKAGSDAVTATLKGDSRGVLYAEKRVEYFTNQLNEVNPILTEISDAMMEEGESKREWEAAIVRGDEEGAQRWHREVTKASRKKDAGGSRLKECSNRYANLMKALRESAYSIMPLNDDGRSVAIS